MFKRFLSRRPVIEEPELPRFGGMSPTPDEPLAIVGDIHGEIGLLNALIEKLQDQAPDARWVFVGDFIDRGDHSAQVLARLREVAQDRPNTVFIKGNHEEMMLSFLETPEDGGNRWMRHGGLQTMASFGAFRLHTENPPEALIAARDRLMDGLPEGLTTWLSEHSRYFISGNVAVVHAGADPRKPMDAQRVQALTWGHVRFTQEARQDGLWVVHGHTIVDVPQESNGVISVDTGPMRPGA
jgi:serine/threonine protein phosphatase 1